MEVWYGRHPIAECASEAGCWLKTVREDLPQEKDTQEDENRREANGKPAWQILDT